MSEFGRRVDCPPEKPFVAVGMNRMWSLRPPRFRLSVVCLADYSHEGLPSDVRAESDNSPPSKDLEDGETEWTFRVNSSDPDMQLRSVELGAPEHLGSAVINMETSEDPTTTTPELVAIGQ